MASYYFQNYSIIFLLKLFCSSSADVTWQPTDLRFIFYFVCLNYKHLLISYYYSNFIPKSPLCFVRAMTSLLLVAACAGGTLGPSCDTAGQRLHCLTILSRQESQDYWLCLGSFEGCHGGARWPKSAHPRALLSAFACSHGYCQGRTWALFSWRISCVCCLWSNFLDPCLLGSYNHHLSYQSLSCSNQG